MGFLTGFGIFIGAVLLYLIIIIFFPVLKVRPIPIEGGKGEVPPPPKCRRDAVFSVEGIEIKAWLYLPASEKEGSGYPALVMSNGFNAPKDIILEKYALRFADSGWAVLAFDYRYYGESGGTPRRFYHAKKQLEDQKAAVAYLRSRKDVNPDRIVLWGTSASGPYGIANAADDPLIAGVIAQCAPFDHKEDSIPYVRRVGYGFFLKMFVHGQRDKGRMRFGMKPHMIPAYSENGETAMISAPGSVEGIKDVIGDNPSTFRNEVCARSALMPHPPSPIKTAEKVKCPVLILVCGKDEIVSPRSHIRISEVLGDLAEVEIYPIGHFDIYMGENFEKAVFRQIRFLEKLN